MSGCRVSTSAACHPLATVPGIALTERDPAGVHNLESGVNRYNPGQNNAPAPLERPGAWHQEASPDAWR